VFVTNGGATWAPAAEIEARSGRRARALAIDPRDPQRASPARRAACSARPTPAARTEASTGLTDRRICLASRPALLDAHAGTETAFS
jgi:hypothetical protein